ncbi:hypothetical protein LY76DRAFT_377790 [Colletotrichum caudatum]|nr:hypothetical protein LY76DRAFT_377790 [Colletotrichum caudatum]
MEHQFPTSSLTVTYDSLLYNEGSRQYENWQSSIINDGVISELEDFVTKELKRGPAKFVERAEGSYNMMFRFRFPAGNDAALRFPKPGHTPLNLAIEKLANEVAWMEYLEANTTIPIPHVHNFSLQTSNNPPLDLPFILMDFIEGDNLRDFLTSLSAPGEDTAADAMRSTVYEQLAGFYLQLNRLRFEKIGSIAKDRLSGQWEVTQRPFTMDMHQLVLGVQGYRTDGWPTKPLERSIDYFNFVVDQQHNQLWGLRNLNVPRNREQDILKQAAEISRLRFRARVGFKQLVPLFCDHMNDRSPFLPFNPDLDPRNMVVDPNTGRIMGIFDLEFTNAMPAQFAQDPPLWLHRVLPGQCLERDFFPWFLETYRPYLDRFLAAMKRVEQGGQDEKGQKPLSTMMLESWTSKQCWFNYAAHNSDHVDAVYWAELHKLHPGGDAPELSIIMESEMKKYVEHTERQIAAFEQAWENV